MLRIECTVRGVIVRRRGGIRGAESGVEGVDDAREVRELHRAGEGGVRDARA